MGALFSSVVLLEGITHIEDRSLDDFIRAVETIKDKEITEKLDGANLWFGLDESGLYTSREGKSPKKGRFYDVSDYPMISNYNAFRAAHLALEQVEKEIKDNLEVGDAVEIEVLFGRQPNTVTYGSDDKNFIVILRGVNETPQERVRSLSSALKNKSVEVESSVISSQDGDSLDIEDKMMTWEFTSVKPLDTKKIDTAEALRILDDLKKFISQKNEVLTDKTNKEVAELNMTSVPKDRREQAKTEKARINDKIMAEYKLPIKEILLNTFVRKVKPFLQSKNLLPSEDIGVEGVVVRDDSDDQIKIVDKDVFTAINSFNSAVRSEVAGLTRTTDQEAPIEMRGGVFGQARIRIADLVGAKELALSSGIKRFISKFKKDTPQETAQELAKNLNIVNVPSVKVKIAAILSSSIEEIDSILDTFKKESGEYKLKLKTGKEIGLSPEIMKRTLTSFAETKKDIREIISRVKQSKTDSDLIMALYGNTIESIFDGLGDTVKETYSLIKSISENDGGGDGGATGAAAVGGGDITATMTTSGAIQPFASKLFGTRTISRRRRNFVKRQKFSAPTSESKYCLIKSISESAQDEKSVENSKDVDDTAAAKRDVEFKQLRNNVNLSDNISQSTVSDYLDKAHELNDEVDTITFGMETSDGDVIKVYVNAQQADKFEEALSQLLGKEDDLEKVVNDLANTFDIVDVVWPESYAQNSASEEPTPEPENNEVDDAPVEIDLSVNDSDETAPEQETSAEDDSLDGELEDEEDKDEELEDKEDEDEDEEKSEREEDEELEDEEDEEESEDGEKDSESPPKKKLTKISKISKAEESQMKTLGQLFKEKLLSEAKEELDSEPSAREKREAAQVENLLEIFPLKQQKVIINLMIALGAPVRGLVLHKVDLKKSIDSAADLYVKNASLKRWVTKLLAALEEQTVTENSNVERRLSTKYQRVILLLLRKMGMPSSIETSMERALVAGIKSVGKRAVEDKDIAIYLMGIANIFGVSDRVADMPDSSRVTEELLQEDAEEASAAVIELMRVMGVDTQKQMSLEKQLVMPSVKSHLSRLSTQRMILSRMQDLVQRISKVTKLDAEKVQEAVQGWSIEDLGSKGYGIMNSSMRIKLSKDEAAKLRLALEGHQKSFSLKSRDGKRFMFEKHSKGHYTVKEEASEKHPDGLKMTEYDIKEILNVID